MGHVWRYRMGGHAMTARVFTEEELAAYALMGSMTGGPLCEDCGEPCWENMASGDAPDLCLFVHNEDTLDDDHNAKFGGLV